ncbi:hypothetical protein GCM10009007_04840 [Formosimonas limnophila]|uniref:Lipoprotein n=1 Tax=Formosimonas limnophila TaxID=1384487 RepID=A0A8J3FXT5_9BURK|nr:hypothetical protein [Formosimonas limnophila]GHA67277.1 hypothetical protein GCM10009007_04840 [Formosimonas limnophila]
MVFKHIIVSVLSILSLSACKLEGNASVSSDARVFFSVTYDMSLVLEKVRLHFPDQPVNKAFTCESMISANPNLTNKLNDLRCEDARDGVVVVSGSFRGNQTNGVKVDDINKTISVNAVRLFRTMVDVTDDGTVRDGTQRGKQVTWLPVARRNVEQYKNEGVSITLNLTMPAHLVSVDGVKADKKKGNVVNINFIDIAGKPNYVVVGCMFETCN